MTKPVQIVSVREDNSLELHEDALKSVLLQERFKDMPVAVVSVVGKYRQGKSFLLGFFLRYLQKQGCEGWLQDSDVMTGGFEWRASATRVTTGIVIWPEPMITTRPNGEKLAVLLMDSQGMGDVGTNAAQDVAIFALSALLSSVLVFNVKDVGKHDLDSLRLFLENGVLAAKKPHEANFKPFQTLHFLVRDWLNPKTHAHGSEGGSDYLKHITNQGNGGKLREALDAAFSKVGCFLMPHPGMVVASDEFQGLVQDVDKKFLDHLRDFVPLVLGSQHLAVKENYGRKVTFAELLPVITSYFTFFTGEKCPTPETILKTNKTTSYTHALTVSKEYFDSLLVRYENAKFLENIEFELKNDADATHDMFLKTIKPGCSTEVDNEYLDSLAKYIASQVQEIVHLNNAKKQSLDLAKEKQLLSEKSNDEKKNREEELERMKETKQKDIDELVKNYELIISEREKEIAKIQATRAGNLQMLRDASRNAEEKRQVAARSVIFGVRVIQRQNPILEMRQINPYLNNGSYGTVVNVDMDRDDSSPRSGGSRTPHFLHGGPAVPPYLSFRRSRSLSRPPLGPSFPYTANGPAGYTSLDVNRKFQDNHCEFAPMPFVQFVPGPQPLAVNKDMGRNFSVARLVPALTNYTKFSTDGKCPAPENNLKTNKAMSYTHALTVSKAYFDSLLVRYENAKFLENIEVELKNDADATHDMFLKTIKPGCSTELVNEYLDLLAKYIASKVQEIVHLNNAKKQSLDLAKEKQLLSEKSNGEKKNREEELERMKEMKQKEIDELVKNYELIISERDRELAGIQATRVRHLQMLRDVRRNAEEKRQVAARSVILRMRVIQQQNEMEIIRAQTCRADSCVLQ